MSRKGYTLLELLLVLAILIIITAVSLPSLEAMYGDTRIRGAADDVRGAWAEARTRSIDTGLPYKFAVMKDKEKFRIAPDSPEFWDGSKGSGGDADMDDGKDLVGSLPKGIVFKLTQDLPEEAGGWRTIVVFVPDGTCRNDARIVIDEGKSGKQSLAVSVRGLTGIVTVKTKKQEEGR